MKRTSKIIWTVILCLALSPWTHAAQSESDLFIYTLPKYDDSRNDMNQDPIDVKVDSASPPPALKLDHEVPCDLKCGIGHTGLFLLYIAAEGQKDQQYRYSLMNPNYEP
ncbi:hypothetical protein HOP39_22240 [Vibrio coralliilyticus]|nr:hypothetical protein [Vibrio coralliilyticus]